MAGASLMDKALRRVFAESATKALFGDGPERGIDLFFEVDAWAPEGQQAGIHCRHRGDVAAAMEFFQVVGEDWRAPHYRDVAQRLPEGWWPKYAAFFAGRSGALTRLELILFQ